MHISFLHEEIKKLSKKYLNENDLCQSYFCAQSLSINESISDQHLIIINMFRKHPKNGDMYLMIIVSRVIQSEHRIIGGTYECPIKSGRV